MHDNVERAFIKNGFQLRFIAYIAFNELEVRVAAMVSNIRPLDVRRIEIIQVIDDGNMPITFSKEMICEMRANKTGAAGQKKILFHDLINTSGMNKQQSLKIAFHRAFSQFEKRLFFPLENLIGIIVGRVCEA